MSGRHRCHAVAVAAAVAALLTAGSASAADTCNGTWAQTNGPIVVPLGIDLAAVCSNLSAQLLGQGGQLLGCGAGGSTLTATYAFGGPPITSTFQPLPAGCSLTDDAPTAEVFRALGLDAATIALCTGWGFATVIFFWALGFPIGVAISAIRRV